MNIMFVFIFRECPLPQPISNTFLFVSTGNKPSSSSVAETDVYETDKKMQNLIDWVCLSEQIKTNNNTIRNLAGEYKKIEPDCWQGVRAQLERMKELCKERNDLYNKQNDLKGQKQKIEKSLER